MADATTTKPIPAPELPYRPIEPKSYHPAIALIGCGGITGAHLGAYKDAGYNVAALCDIDEAKAQNRSGHWPRRRVRQHLAAAPPVHAAGRADGTRQGGADDTQGAWLQLLRAGHFFAAVVAVQPQAADSTSSCFTVARHLHPIVSLRP